MSYTLVANGNQNSIGGAGWYAIKIGEQNPNIFASGIKGVWGMKESMGNYNFTSDYMNMTYHAGSVGSSSILYIYLPTAGTWKVFVALNVTTTYN
jgi:hypothetical protein